MGHVVSLRTPRNSIHIPSSVVFAGVTVSGRLGSSSAAEGAEQVWSSRR